MTQPTRVIQGDVLTVLATLPADSVHCVVTSPPYWGLRDYGTGRWEGGSAECDHKEARSKGRSDYGFTVGVVDQSTNKASGFGKYDRSCKCGATRTDKQIGLEPTPEAYVAKMVEVFREVRRVLRPDGTLWCNMGDAYNSGTSARRKSSQNNDVGYWQHAGEMGDERVNAPGLKPKDLVGIPWRLAFALQADGWWLRSDIIWHKPNPMPESVTDRPTKSHEYVFLLTKNARYFYDAEAVKEAAQDWGVRDRSNFRGGTTDPLLKHNGLTNANNAESGRNLRDVWTIASQPYPEAHFATFPEALVEKPILAGTSEKGCCAECGAPWERVTEKTVNVQSGPRNNGHKGLDASDNRGDYPRASVSAETTGWRATCTHAAAVVPCTVLDPFLGSGTTLAVARRLGRNGVGIELSHEYVKLAEKRLEAVPLAFGAT